MMQSEPTPIMGTPNMMMNNPNNNVGASLNSTSIMDTSNTTTTAGMATTTGLGSSMNDKSRLIVDRASRRITAIEDSVISKYDALQGHKHPKLFMRISIIMVLLSVLCFCIWILTTPTGYPWFIHIVWASALIIGILLIQGSPNYSDKPFSFHTLFFVTTSVKLVIMNEHTPSSFPWSIYPVAVLLLAFLLHGMVVKFRQYLNHFYIHLLFYSVINFVIFVTYCYTIHDFPWFLIVIGAWTVILLAHFAIWKALTFRFNKKQPEANNDTTASATTTATQPTTQVPIQNYAQTVVPPPQQPIFVPSQASSQQQLPQARAAQVETGFSGEIDPTFQISGLEDNFDENQFFDEDEIVPQKKKGMYEQV
ncbi:hypothetical protein C9374_009031 [Naegleria lovaniensis]|uniref:Transmembrane protein n=1 Tax=Naegleria lovaniensis TaxID=51637 RepID=A0AA88KF52_NAELO|nr:uncharacterized protein C9374_009031 [Naegleria lovaniensis]KAG2377515.1 hypothetical protein C9374_009031 [Naegleria lovaniensis]